MPYDLIERNEICLEYSRTESSILLEHEDYLLSPIYKHYLGKFLEERQRLFPDLFTQLGCTQQLHDAITEELDRPILFPNGEMFDVYPDIVWDAYEGEISEENSRWNGLLIKEYSQRIPKKKSPRKLLLRLRLWDAYSKMVNDPVSGYADR